MQAIETEYAGCRFRSRLEARWAVLLDSLQIPWEYEAQDYATSAGRYLPDFWLPSMDTFLEIKGVEPVGRDLAKICALTEDPPGDNEGQYSAMRVAVGDIPRSPTWDEEMVLWTIPTLRYWQDASGAWHPWSSHLLSWDPRPGVGQLIETHLSVARSARFGWGGR